MLGTRAEGADRWRMSRSGGPGMGRQLGGLTVGGAWGIGWWVGAVCCRNQGSGCGCAAVCRVWGSLKRGRACAGHEAGGLGK